MSILFAVFIRSDDFTSWLETQTREIYWFQLQTIFRFYPSSRTSFRITTATSSKWRIGFRSKAQFLLRSWTCRCRAIPPSVDFSFLQERITLCNKKSISALSNLFHSHSICEFLFLIIIQVQFIHYFLHLLVWLFYEENNGLRFYKILSVIS